MRLFGYARYSSKKQEDGFSIEAQVDAINEWAEGRGVEIVKIYIDRARSGFRDIERREAFQEMWGALLEADDVDGVVVHVSNRFSRNEEEDVALKAVLRRAGKVLLSVTEPWMGGESPAERLTDGIMSSFNQYQSLVIGWESKKGTLAMARRGLWPRNPPMGYSRLDNKRLEPEAPYCDWIVEAFEAYATGEWALTAWTWEAERRGIRQRTGRMVQRSHWRNVFANLLYTGVIPWGGEVYPGLHPAIVERDLFESVRDIIEARRTTRGGKPQRHFYLLRGLLWSDVHEAGMHGNTVKRPGRVFRYYRATGQGSEHNVRCDMVEAGVMRLLGQIRGHYNNEGSVGDRLIEGMLRFAPSVGAVYDCLSDDEARRAFLGRVFEKYGVGVSVDGRVFVRGLGAGFEGMDE